MIFAVSFGDVFKKGFMENFRDISLWTVALILGMSLLAGLFICLMYKLTYSGVMFSRSFCVSLLAMTLITSLIIITITSNIVLSLGMVGALSIVRFRTAIKEPMDIAFLYYSICAGIIFGANLLLIGSIGVIFIGIVLFMAKRFTGKDNKYILMINFKPEAEEAIEKFVRGNVRRCNIKSKSVIDGECETAMEIVLENENTKFLSKLGAHHSVNNVSLVKNSNEFV